jgi:UPF0176 protein
MTYKVAALYQFVSLPDFRELKAPLERLCGNFGLKGSLLLAHEGINGTVAGSPQSIDRFVEECRTGPLFQRRLDDLELKFSSAVEMPFGRLKVRLKKEIVTLGHPAADPTRKVGTYVAAEDWNTLLETPDLVLIDTRNQFEVEMGSFRGAIDPGITRFSEFREFVARELDPGKHKKVAMFCTGGIRCEKASSFMLSQGFETVYHLKGGILKYLETVPEIESRWAGECFVFDQRVALAHGLLERVRLMGDKADD